ncbi:peptidoglycan-binding protein [Streptomyces sp. H27-C3]|uniref:peptidoglycan-binding protein n=1 Tax=Streptomyces sp. H27-C3 TaxID=3046305 RepID=UPI0024B947E4|nr:peptidoglycan-binding protein [Streptomyces sp. H27-C3]MDJ0466887.1 peptidoglycan-binding protein [Streptomyces sp. H27-C3]
MADKQHAASRRRRRIATGIVVIAAAGAVSATLALSGGDSTSAKAPQTTSTSTVPLGKGDLPATKKVAGSLGHGDPTTLGGGLEGTLTWLPKVGETITRGETLYKVDNRPVTAMYGSTPMYRDLKQGHEGPDVEQLNENLRALGYGAPLGDTYTADTESAVRARQKARGLKVTGTVEKGLVAFVPGALRVAELKARTGAAAAEDILTFTGRERSATAKLPLSDQKLARKGDTVDVVLPGGKTVKGRVTDIETVSSDASDEKGDPGGTEGSDGGGDEKKSEVKVTIKIPDQKSLGDLQKAAVDVDFTSEVRKNVLYVPVTALVARTGGGYGLEVVDGDTTRTVPVQLGMFSNGQVEVKGKDLRPGMKVSVPQ